MTDKRPIAVKFPTFDLDVEVPEIEMSDEIDASLSTATTTRTMKNITETLSKALKSKYGITDKEQLKEKVHDILKLHGLAPENFDPISFASKQVFGDLSTVNDVSVDDNANKTETNMTAVCVESFLPYQKLLGYDYLYQFIKELYGKKIAKECTADMYDFSLFLNDSTKIFLPYCYCIDASKIITEGRNFGQVHSSPAHRISTYISILGDTIREISFNIAGACAVGTFFLDIAHLGIYRERITLDDLRSDKKVRKAMTNHFQQFIHTVNHYSRNAVESPFTNVSCFDRDKLRSLIAEDNYGWYFPKKAAVVEDNNLEDTKEAYKEFVLDYIEELQEIYIDEFDKGDPLRGGLQFPFPVTTCLPADASIVLNKKLTTFGEAFSEFDSGWTDVEDLYTIYQGKEVKINKVYVGETNQLIEISGTNGHPIKVTPDHKFVLENGQKISASEIKVGDRLMIDKKSFTNCIDEYIVDNIKYIDTSERIYNIEVDNEEHLYTLPSGLVTSNCNLSVKNEEDGTCHLMSENNRLLNYICKKDVSRYNIYSSEGTKVASCCRLISDSDFMAYAGGVNSFGGSQVSLGSHRVVTLNFARCAYEAESYDDFKKIVSERVARSGKILKAHKALILRLEKLGKQPWISNGWIDMTHMFSTFGCVGYVEADEILKQKFNHVDFDYMKDFLIFFNEECKKIANQENLIFNIEAIPAEGASPKLAKSDRLLVGGTYDIYANQWCSLWKDYTIAEKQKRDGEINSLMTGGSIVHFSTDAKLTPTQAKSMIMKAIEAGNEHFAINCCYSHCPECNTTIKGKLDSCPECHSKKMEWYTRVIGYFSKVQNWNQTRREKDFPNRKFIHEEDFEKELGK